MLTLVEVRTAQGTLLSLPLSDVSDGLALAAIEGLDPVKATIVSSSFAQMDGQQYQSSRRESRNVKIKLGLEPDYITTSVQDTRTRLYNFFMPKSPLSMRFHMSEGLVVDLAGRVETFETVLFAKDPEVDISIMCFDPDFFQATPTVLNGNTVDTTVETMISYEGTVETGFTFVLDINRSVNEISLYLREPSGTVRSLSFSSVFATGDRVTINTRPGLKSVILTRLGVDSSLLYALTPQSAWLELQPGDNYFRAHAIGAAIPYTLTYSTRYGGL